MITMTERRLLENFQRVDLFRLMCLDEVCHHSPNDPVCLRGRETLNFDPIASRVRADDYERCADCDALMWWCYDIPGRDGFGEELLIEPHTKTCWMTRNDPGGLGEGRFVPTTWTENKRSAK